MTRPKLTLSANPIPISVDLLEAEYGHTKTYQLEETATMRGTRKFGAKMNWNLNEAKKEGIPLRVPSMVVLVTHKVDKPFKFKLKFDIDASIGFPLDPQHWTIVRKLRKKLEPVALTETSQLVPLENNIDSDFTSLDLESLTKTNFTNDP